MSKKRKGRHPKKGAGGGRTTPKGTQPGLSGSRPRFDGAGPSAFAPPPLGGSPFGGSASGSWGGPTDGHLDDRGFDDEFDPDLDGDLDAQTLLLEALSAGEPTPLLSMASALINVDDPRSQDPFTRREEPVQPGHSGLVEGLLAVDAPEAIGLAVAFGQLAPDELLRQRVRRAHPPERLTGPEFPEWLANLGDVQVTRVVEQTHVLGDGDDLLVGGTIGGHPFTTLVYVDHNLGTAVKDGFVSPDPLDSFMETIAEAGGDRIDDYRFTDISLADARAKLTEAIDRGAMIVPRIESDTWPDCRPLVEWIVGHMPDGGTSYQRPEWSEEAIAALIDDFMASAEGKPFDDGLHRDLMHTLVWFGTDYGPGDPLRWSEVSVEILLVDWVPRKISAEVDYLSHVPELLRGFIRYCHRVREIPSGLTRETLDSVDRYAPTYQRLIRSDRLQGPEALLTSLGLGDQGDDALAERGLDGFMGDGFGEEEGRALAMAREALFRAQADPVEMIRRDLEEQVGGAEALAALDADPLPDEPFDWAGVPDDVRERVAEVLELLDRFADELMDVEFRTATRRLLAMIARDGAVAFRRKGAATTAAAAIAWLVARGNGLLAVYSGRGMYAKDLLAAFGVKGSVSARAGALLRAADIDDWKFEHRCPVNLLTSSGRMRLIEQRDDLPRLAEILRDPPS